MPAGRCRHEYQPSNVVLRKAQYEVTEWQLKTNPFPPRRLLNGLPYAHNLRQSIK